MDEIVIDAHTFDALQANAGADFVKTLVDVFAEEAPRLVTEMQNALGNGERDRFLRAAHALKSDSRTFGAMRLADAARALERDGLTTDRATLDALAPEVATTLTTLMAMAHR